MILEVKNPGYGIFEGPCLYVELSETSKDPNQKHPVAFYFDIGRGAEYWTGTYEWRRLVRGGIAISHLHPDHCAYTELFDHLIVLGIKPITIWGPRKDEKSGRGINESVLNALNTYIQGKDVDFTVRVIEVDKGVSICRSYEQDENRNFVEVEAERKKLNTSVDEYGIITLEDNLEYCLKTLYVEHDIPTLAFSLEERIQKINFDGEGVQKLGIKFGRWAADLKKKCHDLLKRYKGSNEKVLEYIIEKLGHQKIADYSYTVKELIELRLLNITLGPNAKFTYITDTVLRSDCKPLLKLAENSDLLVCDARYLPDGVEKTHTTFQDAASFAKKANVKELVIAHSGHDAAYFPRLVIQRERNKPLKVKEHEANTRERQMVKELIDTIFAFGEDRRMWLASNSGMKASHFTQNIFVLGADREKFERGELLYRGKQLKRSYQRSLMEFIPHIKRSNN